MSHSLDLNGLPDDIAGVLIIRFTPGATENDMGIHGVKWQPINLWRTTPMNEYEVLTAVKDWVAAEEMRQALEGDITPDDILGGG